MRHVEQRTSCDTCMRRCRMGKRQRCTYARGEPASSLRSQPGGTDGEGWVEDSTGVGGRVGGQVYVDGTRRGKWVKGMKEYIEQMG